MERAKKECILNAAVRAFARFGFRDENDVLSFQAVPNCLSCGVVIRWLLTVLRRP